MPIDDDTNASRLGWDSADRPARLRLVVVAYRLDRPDRLDLLAAIDNSIANGTDLMRRRVEAGDTNFITMWNDMGGVVRFDRRRRYWWTSHRQAVVRALC